ncbi:ribose 5-phosphate isomerase B [Cerasicoccus arenae]|uniref:Ribose-5-phosphate isomerase n=1 Tax=Cerasicoccus arenae TaxID=424488 RepID=A0A8J3DIZ9_9BACT|nr:ribose 5-phosphate isomerase B [Cerasicoccus arenae]MBK1859832.1 ribose 5-phosphate isomerase B [Cerasicoccus arenae]GHC08381.1 ribose-5-phosphate isomerase [Cerasicoccus arenae]
MKIAIGSDHGGVDLKDALVSSLQEEGHEVIDRGTHGHESVDYPDYGEAVANDVASQTADFGVLICTTGIGISISANKVHGIRAAVCHNEDAAEFCRRHNNANIICFGQKYDTPYMAAKMTRIFVETAFDGGRHERRIDKISAIEAKR